MLLDVHTLMRVSAAYLPDGLVTPAAIRALAALPRSWPACSQIGGFELRLEADTPRVDFSACIRVCDGGREAVQRWLSTPSARALLSCDAEPIAHLFDRWASPHTTLHDDVPAVWIEFDVDPTGAEAPRPFAVFTLTPPWLRDGSWSRFREETVVGDGIAALGGERHAAALRKCIQLLPRSAGVLHAAVRPRDGRSDTRLIVSSPWHEIPAYLQRLAAPVDVEAFTTVLAELCSETWYHSFHLDVGETVGSRVGVEFFFPTAPSRDPRWISLFDRLERTGICTRRKRELLASWVGDCVMTPRAKSAGTARELLVKIVDDGGRASGKAYLPFRVTAPAGRQTQAPAR